MSVLACERRGCQNVMCDRYSSVHGYICYDCFEELVSKGLEVNISKFMGSEKRSINLEASRARFEVEFCCHER